MDVSHFVYPFIHQWRSWAPSTFWLLWIVLLCTWIYKHLFKSLLSLLLDINKTWNYMVIVFLVFWGTTIRFSLALHHFAFPPPEHKGSNFPTTLSTLIIFCFLIVAILICVKWYLIVVLICISLMISDVSILSYTYGQFIYLWKNVYSYPLPIL